MKLVVVPFQHKVRYTTLWRIVLFRCKSCAVLSLIKDASLGGGAWVLYINFSWPQFRGNVGFYFKVYQNNSLTIFATKFGLHSK